ncbi:MAG TPA: NADH-quinone oxidoreductase subunit J [Candidatus Marinimicrobia bacterium]|jgi:NADH-quinone oxidoreductase subunit J|nr:NADH-quinone oxidoreductase subunit J [Candidatus Neomarinimicrobiota bacterium]MDP6143149.1 NADH-quinone oxidoreductase subunit J [Candidatus Neomarinimicrobiota bacterium]MDP6260560.1 NADH-quinone oxidoreductase subunit J [Candidatus Neomarinimicrobiota bacterium]MDP7128540.1 NADH-quinone oxidoreductase subunit J [Candidatus Neomarinimicrobiota bacterium]MDP7336309.1 NADH-quinone oxidoreductase subunit J [Candidatus Neomarinimicrobiota bacterium]|tara:strand:- start:532 stop:1020 length:489 start_codon:yes stop_codon:yes gene_type:complete
MSSVLFWIIAFVAIGSAFIVVLNKNLFYSAIALVFTFMGVAGLYVFLWADFMAGVQVMIYVGGILVLILFGIMLTNRISSVNISHSNYHQGIGAVIVIGIFFILGWMILETPWLRIVEQEPTQTVGKIGRLLMTEYLLPFEVASVLLLAALIGAAMLSRKAN